MTDHERGAYTPPTDEPLSFDARQPVRGARPFPFTLVISALILIALVGAIFVFYRSGVREAGQAPQTVGAPVGEMKSAPPPEAQPQDPAAGLEIYQEEGQPAAASSPQFTAPPEQPQPRAATPPVVVTQPPPAAAPTTPVGSAQGLRPALPSAPAAAPAAAPATVAPAPARPAPAAAAPVPKPVAPKPVAAAPAAAPAASGSAAVQIGAYSSQALADKGWSDAVSIAGGGHGKSVERIAKDGHTLFRTAVTGFASKTQAAAYCAKLKAAGKACFVR